MSKEAYSWYGRMRGYVERDFQIRGVRVYLMGLSGDGKHKTVATGLIMKELDEDANHSQDATFSMTDQEAQHLLDQLWRAGYRPTEEQGAASALAATERHLQDMRSIVFDKLLPELDLRVPEPKR